MRLQFRRKKIPACPQIEAIGCIKEQNVENNTIAYAMNVAERVIALFRPDDAELIALGARALRYECLVYSSVGFVTMSNMFLQNTRKTIRASVLAASRQGFMLFLALHVGRKFFGLTGIISAQPAADALTFLLAVPFAWSGLREMR